MKRKKRNQATASKHEELITSVLEDLNSSPSISSHTGTVGQSFLSQEGVTTNNSENTDSFDVPEGLLLTDVNIGGSDNSSTKSSVKSTVTSNYASTEEEATTLLEDPLKIDTGSYDSHSSPSLSFGPGPVVPPRPLYEDDISEKTVVAPFRTQEQAIAIEHKVSHGSNSPNVRASAFEAQFLQVENFKFAQQRIIELEKDLERLRKENEILSSSVEHSKQLIDDYVVKINLLEKQKNDQKEASESELQIFREGLNAKDVEIVRLRSKVEELENRLANDLRKIRVRERELENRLELARLEKTALLKSKDETILELKRRVDSLQGDLESYQNKVSDLNQKIEANQAQFGRTVRALRIALTNLEVSEGMMGTPIKKAE